MVWVFLICMLISLLSCSRAKIAVPEVDGYSAVAEDTDWYPVYDRAYYERTLPDDRRCRIRYTADFDYAVFSGNRYVSERTSPGYLYASQYSDEFEARGQCSKEPEVCEIRPLRRGYTITIGGDRLNLQGVEDWNELVSHVNFMYRHLNCQRI